MELKQGMMGKKTKDKLFISVSPKISWMYVCVCVCTCAHLRPRQAPVEKVTASSLHQQLQGLGGDAKF